MPSMFSVFFRRLGRWLSPLGTIIGWFGNMFKFPAIEMAEEADVVEVTSEEEDTDTVTEAIALVAYNEFPPLNLARGPVYLEFDSDFPMEQGDGSYLYQTGAILPGIDGFESSDDDDDEESSG